jgi:hypothetical protein
MNSRVEGNGIRSQQDAMNLVSQVRFSGCVFLFLSSNFDVDHRFLLPASLPSVLPSTRKCFNLFFSARRVLDALTSPSSSSPSLTVRLLSLFFLSSL